MYVNPVVVGVVFCLLGEIALLAVIGIVGSVVNLIKDLRRK